MITRLIVKKLREKWETDNKILVVTGARQVGKSTLLKDFCQGKGTFLYLNGDDPDVILLLENAGEKKLKQIIGNHKLVLIDEAQRVPNIGIISKIIHDQINAVKLILSGSSSFDLSNKINEPLTGRKWEILLWQISWQEFTDHFGYVESNMQLENRVIHGMYPEVIMRPENQTEILKQLTNSYLYKDILNLHNIRKPEVLDKLLYALAFQIGNEVNYNELSGLLKIDRKTVEHYIYLLEQLYVIFRLNPLTRNERNEIGSSRKIYFYDTGIRNAIIDNFKPLNLRNDAGSLWENFVIAELKKANYLNIGYYREFFWRTYQKQEIDYILEHQDQMYAIEIKLNKNKKVRFSSTFRSSYPDAKTQIIHMENFNDFLLETR